MALEIIRRKDGELSQKQEIRHECSQFSLNSYGHLCIREFDKPLKGYRCEMGDEVAEIAGTDKCAGKDEEGHFNCCTCDHYKLMDVLGEEHLVVLDQKATNELIQFIFSVRSTYELKELLKGIIKNELPF